MSTPPDVRVPDTVTAGGDVVRVRRAWPGKERDGVMRVVIEGPDDRGRLRAGTVELGRGGVGRVRLLSPGSDPGLPALEVLLGATDAEKTGTGSTDAEKTRTGTTDAGAAGTLLVHRAGRRAVVRTPQGYVKVLRPGRAPGVAAAAEIGAVAARGAGFAVPEVREYDDDTVTFSVVPGHPVHELPNDPAWSDIWATWADGWLRFQQGDVTSAPTPGDPAAPGLAAHTCADEADVVRTWSRRARAAGLLAGTPWDRRARDVAAALLDGGDPAWLVVTHRDLHDKQLLWDGETLGVLDLDTVCLADPVLDLANLAVHADLRRAQGRWPAAGARIVEDAARRVAAASVADVKTRWAIAELATVARLACVYAFRPRWREEVLRWADARWGTAGELS